MPRLAKLSRAAHSHRRGSPQPSASAASAAYLRCEVDPHGIPGQLCLGSRRQGGGLLGVPAPPGEDGLGVAEQAAMGEGDGDAAAAQVALISAAARSSAGGGQQHRPQPAEERRLRARGSRGR